ncbi:MAG TPA: PPOX class F420-dependent oxidoreductase [Candidatus Binataceae bacterium]|jgi:PPOX class probable F420-dependent enzyme|nr:PPOX class F420-dependent oxidoreductase [Candidatus Binataceae bacterium]
MKDIPSKFTDLFADQTKAFASVATVLKDGSPQVTPVWFDTAGDYIRINTASGRVKSRTLLPGRKVALAIMDPANPYRYIQVRGTVTKVTKDGADAHIDKLAQKYMGRDYPFRQPGEDRIIIEIAPESVQTMG